MPAGQVGSGQVKVREVYSIRVYVKLQADLCVCSPQASVAVYCRNLLPELHAWHPQLLLSSPWSQIYWVAPHGGADSYQV